MSKFSRWAIGVTALIGSGVTFLAGLSANEVLPHGSAPVLGLSAFFSLIALACFVTSAQPIALRIIGAVVFVGYVVYAATSIGSEDFARSVQGLLIIGVPCGYMAFLGKYPRWGAHAHAFKPKQEEEDKAIGGPVA